MLYGEFWFITQKGSPIMTQYDSLADAYSNGFRFSHTQNRAPYETLLQVVGLPFQPTAEILDLACGDGALTRMLAHGWPKSVIGVDESEKMLAVARKRRQPNDPISYIPADCSRPMSLLNSKTYDLVTAAFLLNYSSTIEMLRGCAANIAKHLKPGGRFVGLTGRCENPVFPLLPGASHWTEWVDEGFKPGSRIRIHLYDNFGRKICDFYYHWWPVEAYEDAFDRAELVGLTWTPVRINLVDREVTPNWADLEDCTSAIVISAKKP